MTKKTHLTIKDAKEYDIPGGRCYLYPDSPTGRLSCALVEETGRYPKKGFKQNAICTEAFFVIEGKLKVTVGKKTFTAKANDVVYIPPNTPYAVEGEGKTFVFIEPKWDSAQNTAIDSNQ